MSLNQKQSLVSQRVATSRRSTGCRWMAASILMTLLFAGGTSLPAQTEAQGVDAATQAVDPSTEQKAEETPPENEVKVWEFAPYEVDVWYAFEKDVPLSPLARSSFIERLEQDLERAFRAAWQLRLMEVPPELRGEIARDFDSLALDDLTLNELVLVVSAKHPATKTVRTLEAAVDAFGEVPITAADKQQFDNAIAQLELPDNAVARRLQNKLSDTKVDVVTLRAQLIAGEIPAAFMKKREVRMEEAGDSLRPLLTWLPWQPSAVMRQRDKILLLLIGSEGNDYTFRAREIDCQMQFLGPTFKATATTWPFASRSASKAIINGFAPVARVEEAEARSANVRSRAGGLIVNDENPARIKVGDVMQPVIRRDDRNGMPVLLQPLGFTYAAITETDGIKGLVNVYTYSGGPGLQGRQNRRTQRVLLRVRPVATQSDIQIAVRGEPGKVQAGCFIYDRDLLTEEFNLIGRTDWRGQLTIQAPEKPVGILPEAIRAARLKAKLEAEQKKREREEAAKASIAAAMEEGNAAAAVAKAEAPTADNAKANDEVDGPDEAVIYLNQPLVHLYIKSGDMVLAKLPYVPGVQEMDIAELTDDSLRLKSEAFVRGFQGEILDLIGLRNLLAARVRLLVKENKVDKAKEVLEEFRRLRTFNEMRDQLSLIQRRMLEEAGQDVPRSARVRIDRMFQTTRDMLQKYLQDDLLAEAERLVNSDASS